MRAAYLRTMNVRCPAKHLWLPMTDSLNLKMSLVNDDWLAIGLGMSTLLPITQLSDFSRRKRILKAV